MSNIVLITLFSLFTFILILTLCIPSHFSDKETEAKRGGKRFLKE